MLNTPSKLALSALCIMTTATGALAQDSNRTPDASVKSMSFKTKNVFNQEIHVVSTDKLKWNKIKSGSISFSGSMKIDTKWPGYVDDIGVLLGECGPTTCNGHRSLFSDSGVRQRDYAKHKNFTVNVNQIPAPSNLIQLVPYAKQMIGRCNEKLSSGGPTQGHSFDFEMKATLLVDTRKRWRRLSGALAQAGIYPVRFGDRTKTAAFTVRVVCDPVPPPLSNDVAFDFGDFKVRDIKLFLSTFSNANSHPNPGTTCKKARIKVRLTTSKPGLTHFKLWTKIGGAAATAKDIAAQASPDGNGGF